MDKPTYNILVVDDAPEVLAIIGMTLENNGYNVQLETDAVMALDALSRVNFDLVITDILMPKTDGIELMKKISQSHPDLPIISISSGGSATTQEHIYKVIGSYTPFFLKKPFSKDLLLKTVSLALTKE